MVEVQCYVELFGGLRVRQGRRTLTRFRTQKTAALLAFLAFHGDRMHPREVLVEMLWPDAPTPAAGRTSLSVALSSLRSQLEPPDVPAQSLVLAERHAVGLSYLISSDVACFESLLDRAERACSGGDYLAEKQHLAEAVPLYRDVLLPGYYEPWIVPQQERLAERFRLAVRRLAALHEADGDLSAAVACAQRAAQADPLDEAAAQDLARLLRQVSPEPSPAGSGTPGGASPLPARRQAAFATASTTAPAVSAARHSAPAAAIATAAATLTASPAVRPERNEVPKGRSETAPASAAALLAPPRPAAEPLPTPLTRFYGRQEEMAQLLHLLDSGGNRLLTLTGPGGAGKTRLALEVARALRRRGLGDEQEGDALLEVYFVALQDADTPAVLIAALRSALGVTEERDPGADPLGSIIRALGDRPVLLVLDNFEQLAAQGAGLLERLLLQVPELTCLVTSRQRLPILGEREVPVGPLPTPPLPRRANGDLAEEELADLASLLREQPAVALFVDRAQLARPDFQITRRNAASIVELMHRLEGIPLAIELAAARTQVLTPRQMLDRLNQRFDLLVSHRRVVGGRHHSLREALQLSCDLLSPELRRLFALLSVFRGGFAADAAEAVADNPLTLDLLAQLCDTSLIRIAPLRGDESDEDGVRFLLLETVREFARELLLSNEYGPEERAAAEDRHRAYYATLAETAEQNIRQGRSQAEWLDRVSVEHDNCRAALRRVLRRPRAVPDLTPDQEALRLLTALHTFWFLRGHCTEGRSWNQQFWTRWRMRPGRLGVSGDAQQQRRALDVSVVARGLNGAGVLAMEQGDHVAALRCYRRSLWLRRRLGDTEGVAATLTNWGISESRRGDFARARRLHEHSLAKWRALGDQHNVARCLTNLGVLIVQEEGPAAAEPLFREAGEITRTRGDLRSLSVNLTNLAVTLYQRGRHTEAEQCLWDSLRAAVAFKGKTQAASALLCLGFVRCAKAEPEDGDTGPQLLRLSIESFAELGKPLPRYAVEELRRFTPAAAPGSGFPYSGLEALQHTLERWLPEHAT